MRFGTAATEKMRITSAGLVGIGTSTPAKPVHVYSATTQSTVGESDIIRLAGQGTDSTVGARLEVGFNYSSGTTQQNFATMGFVTTDTTAFCKGDLYFATRSVTTNTAPTERMRIDSSGVVSIASLTNTRIVTAGASGSLTGNASFSFDGTNFVLDGSTKVQILGSGAKLQMQTPTASANWVFETSGTNLTASSAQSGQFNIYNASAGTTFGVGLATPSTSGAGITFPATQSASSDAHTLDDYEEGIWTPIATSDVGSITSYSSDGFYTKIGNSVTVQLQINLISVGTASGGLNFSGLPFTSKTVSGRPSVFLVRENENTGVAYQGIINSNNTIGRIDTLTNGPIVFTNNYRYTGLFTYLSK
jgi:hypothetical protein